MRRLAARFVLCLEDACAWYSVFPLVSWHWPWHGSLRLQMWLHRHTRAGAAAWLVRENEFTIPHHSYDID